MKIRGYPVEADSLEDAIEQAKQLFPAAQEWAAIPVSPERKGWFGRRERATYAISAYHQLDQSGDTDGHRQRGQGD